MGLLLLLIPVAVNAQTMNIRILVGTFPQGEMVGTWHNPTNFFALGDGGSGMVGTGGNRRSSMDFVGELGLQFTPYLGIAMGLGYMHLGMKGDEEIFSQPAGSEFIGDFTFSPLYKSNLYNAYVSAIFTLPLRTSSHFSLFAGAGYYIGSIQCYDAPWTQVSQEWGSGQFAYVPWIMESSTGGLGFHAGVSLEFPVSSSTFVVLEGIYRKVELSDFSPQPALGNQSEWEQIAASDTSGLVGDQTFVYAQLIQGDANQLGDIFFNADMLKLIGFGWRLGLKFTF